MVIIEGVAVSLYVFCFLLGWKRNRFILNPLSIFLLFGWLWYYAHLRMES